MKQKGKSGLRTSGPRRWIVALASLALVTGLCVHHGICQKEKTLRHLDRMMEAGVLKGLFWQIEGASDGRLTVAKFGRRLTLLSKGLVNARPGRRISFVARIRPTGGESEPLWVVERAKIHIPGVLKYGLSGISVFIVLIVFVKHWRLDRATWSFMPKEGKSGCPRA